MRDLLRLVTNHLPEVIQNVQAAPAAESITEALRQLFENAPGNAKVFGLLGILVGLVGLLISGIACFWYLRDYRFLRKAKAIDTLRPPPRGGFLKFAIGELLTKVRTIEGRAGEERSAVDTQLSPDAAWEFARTRLESTTEMLHSVTRFFAYAPLLLGLCGTILALSELVAHKLGGPKFSQGELEQLQGVFVGTLGGILGSLAAWFGDLALSGTCHLVNTEAENYVHSQVLRKIPDRRIAVKIEEAILQRIAERADGVVDVFAQSLRPLAAELQETARKSARAAESASGAFTTSVEALREAGNVLKAAKQFARTVQTLDGSAGTLEKATALTRDLIERQSGMIGDMKGAGGALRESAGLLSEASKATTVALGKDVMALRGLVDGLAGNLTTLGTKIEGISKSFDALAADVKVRNKLESEEIGQAHQLVEKTGAALEALTVSSAESRQELAALRQTLEKYNEESVGVLRTDLEASVGRVTTALQDTLQRIGAQLPEAAAILRSAGEAFRDEIERARLSLPEIQQAIEKAGTEIRRVVEAVGQFAEAARRLAGAPGPMPVGGVPIPVEIQNGFLTSKLVDLLETAQNIQTIIGQIQTSLPEKQASRRTIRFRLPWS